MTLPTEILLQIGNEIKNMWQREDYLVSLGIDTIYYKNKSRPVSKDFNPFPILPSFEKYRVFGFITTRIELLLPIRNEKLKQPKMYKFKFEHTKSGLSNLRATYWKTILMRGGRNYDDLYSDSENWTL